jgi:hypothetical protein
MKFFTFSGVMTWAPYFRLSASSTTFVPSIGTRVAL